MAWATHSDAETAVNALEAHFCRLLAVSTPTITGGATTAATTGTGMVVNTSSETSLVDFTVAAAQVAAGDVLVFDAGVDLRNNSGGAVTYTFRAKLGGTTIFTSGGISYNNASSRYRVDHRTVINLAALADQRIKTNHTGFATTGLLAGSQTAGTVGAATENLATDKTLSLTVQMGTANADADARLHAASLTRLR